MVNVIITLTVRLKKKNIQINANNDIIIALTVIKKQQQKRVATAAIHPVIAPLLQIFTAASAKIMF